MAEKSFWDKSIDEVTFSEFKAQLKKDFKRLAVECAEDVSNDLISDYSNPFSMNAGFWIKRQLAKIGVQNEEVAKKEVEKMFLHCKLANDQNKKKFEKFVFRSGKKTLLVHKPTALDQQKQVGRDF